MEFERSLLPVGLTSCILTRKQCSSSLNQMSHCISLLWNKEPTKQLKQIIIEISVLWSKTKAQNYNRNEVTTIYLLN